MRLLVLGGTVFVGRHIVDAALARGHHVTLFNRGRHAPGLFAERERVEILEGDRDGELAPLGGLFFDAVIDTCRETPSRVERAARVLNRRVGLYVYISSISVYRDLGPALVDETSVLVETGGAVEPGTYPCLKVLCERAVERLCPENALIVRPGLIVGPHDPTDRFTYWVRRAGSGGAMLVPGTPERPVQFIDARDLAAWTIRSCEERRRGTVNVTGPVQPQTMGGFLDVCLRAADRPARPVWVGEEFALAQGLAPYSELPLWLPEATHPFANQVESSRARARGLATRPLVETVAETAAWDLSRGRPALVAGLAREREESLLELWKREEKRSSS